ncbi:MAG: signal peptidase II [Cyanobacteriota bacterium]|nr:signal peptidase II [Cyanobacteriota bacterium]
MRPPTTRAGSPLWRPLALSVALTVVALDQVSKHWAVQNLSYGRGLPLWPGLLNLQLVRNTGAAFSLFTGLPQLLGLVSLLVSVALLGWILRRPPRGLWESLALGFLLGGALGNGLDRWRLGAVIDFLALVPIQFPVFNLADVAINLAVLCFVLHLSPWRRSSETPHD